jgi:hypothetical protein
VYNTADNEPVDDKNSDVDVEMIVILKHIVMIFGIMCVVLSFLLWIFLFVFKEAKVVKAAQANMSQVVVCGGGILGGRVINAAMHINDISCTTGLWLGHIGFFFVFGTLLVKTWRIYRLLQAGLKKIKISENYVLGIVGAGTLCLCAYLTVLTLVGKPHVDEICTLESHEQTCLKFCSFDHSEFHSALFAFEACMLIYGAFLCYGTKGAPDSINEAKFIALAMTLICVVSALVFPLVFLIDMNPADRQLIASVSIAIVTMASLGIMFWPKVLAVYAGNDMNWSFVRERLSNESHLSRASGHSANENSVSLNTKAANVALSKYQMTAQIIPEDVNEDAVSEKRKCSTKKSMCNSLGSNTADITVESRGHTVDGVVQTFDAEK